MGLQVELLEQSFAAVAPKGQQIVDTFYEKLFTDYPSVIPLFENAEMATQKTKLLASLKLVIDNLRKPHELIPALTSMGARHVEYGALADHYPAVGATLLATLAEVAGDLWNDDFENAWAEAYGVVSETMLAGAAEVAETVGV